MIQRVGARLRESTIVETNTAEKGQESTLPTFRLRRRRCEISYFQWKSRWNSAPIKCFEVYTEVVILQFTTKGLLDGCLKACHNLQVFMLELFPQKTLINVA